MTAAILCPGPSLARYDGSGDLRIGVNRAALLWECQYWCALDYPMVRDQRGNVRGCPELWSEHQQVQRFGGNDCDTLACDTPCDWRAFSFLVAIVLAAHLGATAIDVWGCDWSGTKDYDGTEAGEVRSDARWQRERRMYGVLQTWLAGKGITITRH